MDRCLNFAATGEGGDRPAGKSGALGSDYRHCADSIVIMKTFQNFTRHGAALMLALWALFFLSAMIITWTLDIDGRISLSGNANRALEAVAMACSGSEVAFHPAVQSGLRCCSARSAKTKVIPRGLPAKVAELNLNWLVSGENPQRLELLRRFLESKGIDLNERDHMIDCLLDWVDPDNLVRLNGAETSENYKPANRLLTRMEDLKKVKGWGEFTSTPGWEDYFTVNSTGPVDIIWASSGYPHRAAGYEPGYRRSLPQAAKRRGWN